MKNSKKNKKGKFVDFNEREVKANDQISLSSPNNTTTFKSIRTHEEYETPLQTLVRLFSNFSSDIIESVYEENNRTFVTAKKFLEDMCKADFPSENNIIEEEEEMQKGLQNLDLNAFTRFKYDDDPFLEDNLPSSSQTKNIKDFKKKQFTIEGINISNILNGQKKTNDDYVSVFTSLANDSTPKNNNSNKSNEDFSLEELTLNYYCDILLDLFPKFTRYEIMQKICDYDFDIDKLIIFLFDENTFNFEKDYFEKLESKEISADFKEEVLCNFYSGESPQCLGFDIEHFNNTIFNHNLQNTIEKEIKKNNLASKLSNNKYTEKDFPFLSDGVKDDYIKSNTISEEYFLEKEIKDIKTKTIREDLQRLSRNFVTVDEVVLKWVYFQFMDYSQTFQYFKKNAKHKGIFDKMGQVDIIDKEANYSSINNKPSSINNIYEESNISNSNEEILFKIISENPSQWKIENNCKNFSLIEYQSIRRKLIWQAQLAWRSGRHQDAKVIMAKARRYKQDINMLLRNKKIKLLSKTNDSVESLVGSSENLIDLHGLTYEESKLVVNKKMSDVNRAKEAGDLDPQKKFILSVITGVGHHSKNNKAILLPRLSAYFKSVNLLFKTDREKGIIRVYL